VHRNALNSSTLFAAKQAALVSINTTVSKTGKNYQLMRKYISLRVRAVSRGQGNGKDLSIPLLILIHQRIVVA
jgi:hypothetical protein